MYISCLKCNTKFIVTPEQIGTNGRRVKCSKCSNIWHQKLDNPIRIEPVITVDNIISPLENGVNLPALLPIKIPPYLYALPFFMVGIIIFMFIMLFPNLFGFDTMLSNKDLAIKDIQIDNQKELGKIVVSYKFLNLSSHEVKMPRVRIRLFDKNNRVIKSRTDNYSNTDMAPNQFVQIRTEFVPAPPSTNSIDIMIGNSIDFLLR